MGIRGHRCLSLIWMVWRQDVDPVSVRTNARLEFQMSIKAGIAIQPWSMEEDSEEDLGSSSSQHRSEDVDPVLLRTEIAKVRARYRSNLNARSCGGQMPLPLEPSPKYVQINT
jgi:hypothetical protein